MRRGCFAVAIKAKDSGVKEFICLLEPIQRSGASVGGIKVHPVDNLKQLLAHFLRQKCLTEEPQVDTGVVSKNFSPALDMTNVAGQELAKRALEIAAAGGHNILLSAAGQRKTLLARAMAGILPDLSLEEALELTKIYSIAGKLSGNFVVSRPVRSPHHTTSNVAFSGRWFHSRARRNYFVAPRDIILDEFPEFPER